MIPVIAAAALGMTVVAALLPIRRIASIDPAAVFKA
jgi:ABC-type lipoprotein release transport system permease subunit